VKIEMYGNAVQQIIAKKQLVRNSSSTTEWLRKVYDISMEEYHEYESKFLSDSEADQYKGTIFQISSDEQTLSVLTPKMKALGYAVVTSPSPEDALEKIEKLVPNVIISETVFGAANISGIRFLHFLRNNSKFNFIPFIFVAGDEDYSLLSSSELRSNEGFVKKPVIFEELFSLMNAKLQWLKEYSAALSK
jgi:DNA-binding NtrC family response regulator